MVFVLCFRLVQQVAGLPDSLTKIFKYPETARFLHSKGGSGADDDSEFSALHKVEVLV